MAKRRANGAGSMLSAIDKELDRKHYVSIGDQRFELKEPPVETMIGINKKMIDLIGPDPNAPKTISEVEEMEIMADIASACLGEEIPRDKLIRFMAKTGGRFSPMYMAVMRASGMLGASDALKEAEQDFPV